MNAMLNVTHTSTQEAIIGFGAGPLDLAACSNCCELVDLSGAAPIPADTETVLLDIPCPRCGEEALRLADADIWE